MLPEGSHIERIIRPTLNLWMNSGKLSKITISGNSMKPILNKGSQVLIEHTEKFIKRGDIVVYLRNNKLVSHRVIRVRTDGVIKLYLTKGDSALRFDYPLISEREIVGVVRGIMKGENLIDFRTEKWKIIGLVLAVCSVVVGVFSKAAVPFMKILKSK